MDIITPSYGTVFWTLIAFILLLVLLRKFAWKPILDAIHEREQSIDDALNKAELAKKEMSRLTAQNEELLKSAREEREHLLKEAKEIKDKLLADAREEATLQGNKLIEKAKIEIENQKKAALADVKNQVSGLSVEIAERLLKQQLAESGKQQELVEQLLKEVKFS